MKQKHKSISITQARKDLSDIFDEVNYFKKRILLTNHNKCIAIVPMVAVSNQICLEK